MAAFFSLAITKFLVNKFKTQPPVSMDLAATNVLKIQLFRDELGTIWGEVASFPMRQLFRLVPLFKLCTLPAQSAEQFLVFLRAATLL